GAGQPDPGQPEQQPAAVRPATGHVDDHLAGDDLPDRRVLHRNRYQTDFYRGRRPDSAGVSVL
ncbi:Circadian clock protein KaiC, partial [Pseudomonas sp. FEN]